MDIKRANDRGAADPATFAGSHLRPSDLRAIARIATDATIGIADLVEAMHQAIARPLTGESARGRDRTRGITGLVYRTVRGVTTLVGGGVDAMLSLLKPALSDGIASPERDAILAALNGVLGDYLAASNSSLAIPMTLRHAAQALVLERRDLAETFPDAGSKIAVLVHGLCLSDRSWNRNGHDYGAFLATRFGYTPVRLHYNSGRHVSTNGRAFAELLEALVAEWPCPVDEIVLVGHSMGGLVIRSACDAASQAHHRWLHQVRSAFFLGTPHLGAPLERGGHWIDVILGATPYAKPFARLGRIRSAGITDLRHGYVRDEDWEGRDRFGRLPSGRRLPLPDHVQCHAIAATLGRKPDALRSALAGDGLVPVDSALGQHKDPARSLAFPRSRQCVVHSTSHLDLMGSARVADRIARWIHAR